MDNILAKMQKEIDDLRVRRVSQSDVIPQQIKNRHLGEPNSYVFSGLAANRPTSGATVTFGSSIYFATDTGVLSIWTGSTWLSVTLS